MDFRRETLAGLAAKVRSAELSARELVSFALERIAAVNPEVNAFVAVDPDAAVVAARRIDERVARNEDPGPLAGIPIGVKSSGMPVGLQLIGPQHGDLVVLRAMAALERALAIDTLPPVTA